MISECKRKPFRSTRSDRIKGPKGPFYFYTMKKKKYWIKYIDMYGKNMPLKKQESEDFDVIYDLYKSLKEIEYTFGVSAFYLHSTSKSFKSMLEALDNL